MDILGFVNYLLTLPAPPWLTWVGALGGFMAVINFCFNLRNEQRKRKNSVVDDFWYRKIVAPFLIDPYFEFLVTQLTAFEALSAKKGATAFHSYLKEFRVDKRKIRVRLSFYRAIDSKINAALGETLRNLEDKITLYCADKTNFGVVPADEAVTLEMVKNEFEFSVSNSMILLRNSHKKIASA